MKCHLYIRTSPDTFYLAGSHDVYLHALTSAWEHGHHRQFFIDTKSRVPSRATQLGEAEDTYIKQKITRTRDKKQKLIEED